MSDTEVLLLSSNTRKKWTKKEICNVQSNFCNLFDSRGVPIFEIFISTLYLTDRNRAEEWLNILRLAGSTHINLAISYDYNENLGWAPRYPIGGLDFTKNLDIFQEIVDWVASKGFIPIIKCSFDGQSFDPNGLTYGWQWGMDNFERIVNSLNKYKTQALWSTGFDGCFPDWTRDQTIFMIQRMRSIVGAEGCIDTEFGNEYIHMGEGAADWADDKLGALDHFSVEMVPALANVNDLDINGPQQIASRILPSLAKNIEPKNYYNNQPPSWENSYLANTTNKDIVIDMYEVGAYFITRKQSTSQDQIELARKIATYGFVNFGNGLP